MIVFTKKSDGLEINDLLPYGKLDKDKIYFLRISTGRFTFKALFELYFLNPKRDIHVSTSNLEFFLFKVRRLKNLEMTHREDEALDLKSTYKEVEDLIRREDKKKDTRKDKKKDTSPSSSPSFDPSFDSSLLSFSPKVFLSISSSLLRPDLYFSSSPFLSQVFLEVKERKRTYEELKDKFCKKKIKEKEDLSLDKILQNLLFTRVFLKKDGFFEVNPLLLLN